MAKIITLDDIRIQSIVMTQMMGEWVLKVSYVYLEDTGDEFPGSHEAVFWQTIPVINLPEGGVAPAPDNWYTLTAGEVSFLATLLSSARIKVSQRVL